MPVNQESLNKELYGILKSRGYRPDMYTSAGKKVAIPDEAEVFQFEFIKDGKKYGKVHVTIDGLHRLMVYYGDDVEKSPKADSHDSESFHSFLQHLKRWSKNKQLGFELSDQDDLEADMAKREHNKREGLNEGYYALGKMKSYSDNVPSTKIILQHNRQIEEGEQRYRNIAKIFVENINGERFLLPTTKPGLARVYARHISEGGTPYDERGQHITSLCEEYAKMAGFIRATKNKQFNESAQPLVEAGLNHYTNLRETLHKMAGKRGYKEYFDNFKPSLTEDEGSIDLSEMFMQTSLDPRIENVMPILSKLNKNLNETSVNEAQELEEWAEQVIETSLIQNADTQKYEQAARDVLKGADFDHLVRVRNLEVETLRKYVDKAWDKVNKGEYKLNRPNLEENSENDNPVASAIFRRLIFTKPEIFSRFGDEAVAQAVFDIADFVGDVEEIGTSDVSGWVNQVIRNLDGVTEGQEKIGGIYDPDEFDAMVRRVGEKAKLADKLKAQGKKPQTKFNPKTGKYYVDFTDNDQPKTNENLDKQQKKAGQVSGNEKAKSIGPVLGNKSKKHPFNGKLVGTESIDPMIRLKNLSGIKK